VTFDLILAGPLPITIVDFWRMIWQEGVETIAMVTNLQENLRKKCERYWPDISSELHGPFRVTLTDTQVYANYVVRELHIEVSSSHGNLSSHGHGSTHSPPAVC
jgi:protein tyrosine phosphatase